MGFVLDKVAGFSSEHFGFALPITVHQCSILNIRGWYYIDSFEAAAPRG
jgi:hypothetical protein